MNRMYALAMGLAAVLTATVAHAAPPPIDDFQAPRGQQDVQAPRSQDVQAPRGQDHQAPRSQDVQAPRSHDDVQAPRGQDEGGTLRR
jgi:hypothetical protein